jgi:hypothetical protein
MEPMAFQLGGEFCEKKTSFERVCHCTGAFHGRIRAISGCGPRGAKARVNRRQLLRSRERSHGSQNMLQRKGEI